MQLRFVRSSNQFEWEETDPERPEKKNVTPRIKLNEKVLPEAKGLIFKITEVIRSNSGDQKSKAWVLENMFPVLSAFVANKQDIVSRSLLFSNFLDKIIGDLAKNPSEIESR